MTPKEKAAELIVNYQLKCKSLNYDEAKQCALIAVDEMIELCESYVTPYYQEVKKEIETL
jgi:hypothetical protein